MTKVNWFDNQHNWIGYFIINALDSTKFKVGELDGNNLDVKFTVDGIEFDFISVVESMGKEFENSVKKKAEELIKEKLHDDVFKSLHEITWQAESLERELTDKVQELIQRERC